ncbi:hypothetical protein ES288_D04G147300v1 [Gossypium darwinii]|uniref:UNC93-like protein n=1 Tax=Gossypium darwinii TaxID=34276 RepID=A0A5D2CWZ0_GOSDA|nr:hypothetical protein ES288_D04G147300v1 [Gossypium darwinii]
MVIDISERETPKSRTRDIHILSCAFLVFLAYGAAQNLETTVNAQGNLGMVTLGTLYVSSAVFSLFASLVIEHFSSYFGWYTMIPVSFFLGLAASIIWVGEVWTYLTYIARSYARDADLHEGTVIGQFNGEFWAMFALHQEGSTSSNRTLLFIVFLCSMTLGTILMCFLHKVVDKEEKVSEDSSVRFCSAVTSTLKSVITPLLNLRMLLIIPLVAYSVLQQSFVWADYTKDVVNPILGEAGVGGAMAVYGALYAIRVLGKVYPLLMAALLGIGDGVLNMQLSALHVLLSKHDMGSAIVVVFFMNPVVTLQTMAVIMLAAIFVSLVPFMYLIVKVENAFSKALTCWIGCPKCSIFV